MADLSFPLRYRGQDTPKRPKNASGGVRAGKIGPTAPEPRPPPPATRPAALP